MVKEGQLLFQLDPKPFQAQLESARGELQAQQARFTTAQANLGRVKPLTQQNALSQSDLDKAQGEFDSAKAAVYSAQAKVTEAELNLGYTTIRSPVNGLASRALQRQGAFVNAQSDSANLTYVAAIDPIWVNFSVSQNLAAKLRDAIAKKLVIEPKNRDYEVEIVLSDNTPYPYRGKINFADPSFSQDTGSFLVRAVLPNPKQGAAPRHVRDRVRARRAAAGRDRRAAARRAAGLERAPRLRRQAGRGRRGAAGHGRRLLRREGHRDRGRPERGRPGGGGRRPQGRARASR